MEFQEEDLGILGRGILSAALKLSSTRENVQHLVTRCEKGQKPYYDFEFPPKYKSLNHFETTDPREPIWKKYNWLRPQEALGTENVTVFSGISPSDIRPGALSDNHLLTALSALAEYPERIERIFVNKEANPWGVYAVNICFNGEWKEVVVDDFFPCGNNNTPVFTKSVGDEIWVMIIEKAMAKCYGSYAAIEFGTVHGALRDLTGAPCKVITNPSEDHWEELVEANSLNQIAVATAGDTGASVRMIEQMGLVGSVGYSLLNVLVLNTREGPVKLVQLRNPWGYTEWNGDWSDNSELWTKDYQKQAGMTPEEDGTFFMSYTDFIEYFTKVTICQEVDGYQLYCVNDYHAPDKGRVYRMTVAEAGQVFIMLTQPVKYGFAPEDNYEYSEGRVVVAKIQSDGELDYVNGFLLTDKKHEIWGELELEPGEYLVAVEFEWVSVNNNYTLSSYSSSSVQFFKEKMSIYDFIHAVYKSAAIKHGTKSDYTKQGITDFDRYFVMTSEGLGAFYLKNNSADKSVTENCYFKQMKGFTLYPPYGDNKYVVTLEPQQELVIMGHTTSKNFKVQTTQQVFYQQTNTALIEQTMKEGLKVQRKDPHTNQNVPIYIYSLRYEYGACYYYINDTEDMILDETFMFQAQGIDLVGEDQEAKETGEIEFELYPGERKFIEFLSNSTKWNIQTSSSYGISLG